jgi:hypothetical protein
MDPKPKETNTEELANQVHKEFRNDEFVFVYNGQLEEEESKDNEQQSNVLHWIGESFSQNKKRCSRFD